MAAYEFWLTDDRGVRLMLMEGYSFASYTRTVSGFGTAEIGIPYDLFIANVQPVFRPDWRLEIWRSPAHGYPMRLERTFLLRKPKVYRRKEDDVQMVTLHGRDAKDLLARRYVIQAAGTAPAKKTDQIDDMMKAVVREQMLYGSALDVNGAQNNTRAYPNGEFFVQADFGLGPSVTRSFADANVLELLKDLSAQSFQLNKALSTNRKIYFDVVERYGLDDDIYILDEDGEIILDEQGQPLLDESAVVTGAQFGWMFVTLADRYGLDRTDRREFSVENGNLEAPWWSKDHLDEVNSVIVKGQGRGESRAVATVEDTARIASSRWNRVEMVKQATYEVDSSGLTSVGTAELNQNRPREELYATILNTPGSDDAPRSLYGLDWDLGDILPVSFAGMQFEAEVVIVYVSIDENGRELVIGRNRVD